MLNSFRRESSQYQAGLGFLVHEEWQEFQTQVHHAGEVGVQLSMKTRQVDLGRLRQIHWMLLARVEKNTINIWVFGGDSNQHHVRGDWLDCWGNLLGHKSIHALLVTDVKAHCSCLLRPMFADKSVESLLPTTDGNNFAPLFNQTITKGGTNARGGANHQNRPIFEWHGGGRENRLSLGSMVILEKTGGDTLVWMQAEGEVFNLASDFIALRIDTGFRDWVLKSRLTSCNHVSAGEECMALVRWGTEEHETPFRVVAQ